MLFFTQASHSHDNQHKPPLEAAKSADEPTTLNIIGLFSMSGVYKGGQSFLPAALLAVKHINAHEDILPGYKLHINAYDTQVDWLLFHLSSLSVCLQGAI